MKNEWIEIKKYDDRRVRQKEGCTISGSNLYFNTMMQRKFNLTQYNFFNLFKRNEELKIIFSKIKKFNSYHLQHIKYNYTTRTSAHISKCYAPYIKEFLELKKLTHFEVKLFEKENEQLIVYFAKTNI